MKLYKILVGETMGKHAGVVCFKMCQNPGIVGSRTLEQIIKWWDPWMVWTRGNAIVKTSKGSLIYDGNKAIFGEDALCFGRPLWWAPSTRWKSRSCPGPLGAPYSPIGLKILVTLKEKIFKAFTFLVLPELEALKRAQGSPLWGKLLFDASGCAKDETTRWVGNGPRGILCTWRAWVAAEILSLNKGTWLWRFCVGITSKPRQPGSYLGA